MVGTGAKVRFKRNLERTLAGSRAYEGPTENILILFQFN